MHSLGRTKLGFFTFLIKIFQTGATHEQNREDRNTFVKIVEEEILEVEKKNFERKESLFSSYGTPYDYGSIMHYEEKAFSKSGKKTILPLMQDVKIM